MANVMVNTWRSVTTALCAGGTANPKWVGWGSGAGTSQLSDTDLFAPATEARVAGTLSQITTTTPNDTYRIIATLTASAPKTITNVMVFDAQGSGSPPGGGNGFCKGDFPGIPLNTNSTITFTISVQLT